MPTCSAPPAGPAPESSRPPNNPAAASASGTYKSSSNNTYTFYNQFVSQSAAERICQDAGGHLAAFNTLAEQKEVESAYIAQGLLLPDYHKHYWLGMGSNRGAWTWIDKAIQGAARTWGCQGKACLMRLWHAVLTPALVPRRPQLQPMGQRPAGRRCQHHLCRGRRLPAKERRLGLE